MSARTLFAIAVLAVGAAAPAAAQRGVSPLRLGDSVRVVISATDPALQRWGRYRTFRFAGEPDRMYRFSARSESGEAGLQVARLSGPLTDYLESAGGSAQPTRALNRDESTARLHFRPPAPGPYLVVVSATDEGAVTLYSEEIGPVPATPQPLAPGGRTEGVLTAASGVEVEDDQVRYYAVHTFAAQAGRPLEYLVTGPVAHAFGRMRNGVFEPIAPAEGAPAERVDVQEDGEYAVRVWATSVEDSAAYTVWLADPRTRPAPRPLQIGQPGEGTYDASTAVLAGGDLVDQWSFRANRGESLRITLASDTFDTYLVLGRVRDGRWEQIDANDDGAGIGLNSALPLSVDEDGEFLLRVRPLGGAEFRGPYTLQVARASARLQPGPGTTPRRARPETRPVRWGAPLTGTLDDADAAAEDGSAYDAWTFTATAGERITITMRSDAFDSYLAVGREEDGEWMELTSNDDFEVGHLHARVVMVAPDTGEYTIRANTFPGQPVGPYTLTVERRR
jgi:hypothetical protein